MSASSPSHIVKYVAVASRPTERMSPQTRSENCRSDDGGMTVRVTIVILRHPAEIGPRFTATTAIPRPPHVTRSPCTSGTGESLGPKNRRRDPVERPSGVMDVIPRSPGAAPEAFTSAVGSRTRAPGRTRPDSRLHCHRRDQPCPSSTAYTIVPDRGTDDAGAGSVPWPRTNQVADATTTSPVMTSASTRRRRSSCSSGAPGIGVEGTTSSGGGAILVETDGDRRGTPAWAGRNKVAPQLGQADPLVDPDQSQRRHSLGRSRAGLMGSPGAGRTVWPRSPRRRPAGSRRRVRHRAAPDRERGPAAAGARTHAGSCADAAR